jgi:hypothetical protein
MTAPSDWKAVLERERQKMTIGIAAACDVGTDNPKFILCSDWQVMSELGAADVAFKQWNLAKGWHALYSGAPDAARAMVHPMWKILSAHKETIDESNVKRLIETVLAARKRELCESFTQGRFGISYEHFLQFGKQQLPEERHKSATLAIENLLLGADLIVAGFASKFPLIIETDQRCGVRIREGFTAIGEGAYLAHASLMHRGHDDFVGKDQAIYNVYEAKKWAERNKTVGQGTTMTVFHRDGINEILTAEGRAHLNRQFKAYGPKKVSDKFTLPKNVMDKGTKITV